MRLAETVRQDLRFGWRALARTPGFTTAAVVTLALGIGATTAIFSAVNAMLLEPLPYADTPRRVMIWSRWKDFAKTWVSDAEVVDYRARCRTLAAVAAWSTRQANLTGDADPLRVGLAAVTPNTFAVLGASPRVGRVFTSNEEREGEDRVAVLSFGLWQRRYGEDPRILERTIHVDGVSRLVVGVMPPGFRVPTDYGEDAAEPTQLWVPLRLDPQNRGSHGLYAAAELRPGTTAAQAAEELKAVTANLTAEGRYPRQMQFTAFAVSLDDEILGGVRPAMFLLMGAVAFLLLIACANVANLLLVRAEARQREFAVRFALGANAWRVTRQLATEGVVLASAAGTLGLALAFLSVRVLRAVSPVTMPRAGDVAIDGRVLAFAAATAIATTLLFSLAPALRLARLHVPESLKEGGQQTMGVRRQRTRGLLAVTQIALAVVLLVGAGLMLRSLRALQQIDLGFDPRNVLTAQLSLPRDTYDTPQKVVLAYQQLAARVRALPGVRHAGLVRSLPLGSTIGDWGLDIEGFVEAPGRNAKGDWQVVSDGAFEAMGERIVAGRPFTPADVADAEPVAVINETMARTYWPNGNALGGRIRMGSNMSRPWIRVVGIVHDVTHNGMTGLIKEKFYVPHAQWHRSAGFAALAMYVVVRAAGDPLQLAGPLRAEVRRLDPNLPVSNIRPLDEIVRASIATPRFTGLILTLFGLLAATLASIGIYGVLAYIVSQRTHEFGIRMAIGAGQWDILRMVMGNGLSLALTGVAAGVGAALLLVKSMTDLLYGVQPLDPVTFAIVPVVLAVVALAASYLPARRATRVSPLVALRTE